MTLYLSVLVVLISQFVINSRPEELVLPIGPINSSALLPPPDPSSGLTQEQQLAGLLMQRCPFLRTSARPAARYTDVVNMISLFQLIKFVEIEDTAETMAVAGFLIVQWEMGECAKWEKDQNWNHIWRIRPIDFPVKEDSRQDKFPFWIPLVWQPNAAENVFSVSDIIITGGYATTYLERNGKAGFDAVGKYVSYCNLAANVTHFPFDVVTCTLEFQAWPATIIAKGDNLGFLTATTNPATGEGYKVPPDFMSGSSVWRLEGIFDTNREIKYGNHNYSRWEYSFIFRRRASSYLVNIFLPAFALFVLTNAAFLMPITHSERSEYSVSVLVNFFLLQAVVDEKLPQSSDPTFISLYLEAVLWIGTACAVYFCVMNRLVKNRYWSRFTIMMPVVKNMRLLKLVDGAAFAISLTATALVNGILFWKMMA